jgi:hypothetical protein
MRGRCGSNQNLLTKLVSELMNGRVIWQGGHNKDPPCTQIQIEPSTELGAIVLNAYASTNEYSICPPQA